MSVSTRPSALSSHVGKVQYCAPLALTSSTYPALHDAHSVASCVSQSAPESGVPFSHTHSLVAHPFTATPSVGSRCN